MNCKCPNCDHEFAVELVGNMAGDHSMQIKISPTPGALLSPLHVGGTLRSFERLLVAIGNDHGFKSIIGLRSLVTDDTGAITADVMVMRRREDS